MTHVALYANEVTSALTLPCQDVDDGETDLSTFA